MLFESKECKLRDRQELEYLKRRYGDELHSILQSRANDNDLVRRDRAHWRRLLKVSQRT